MNIIVHNSKQFLPESDLFEQYGFPLWEIELESEAVDQPEFRELLLQEENWQVSTEHHTPLRSKFVGQGIVRDFVNQDLKTQLLDIVCQDSLFLARFPLSRNHYESRAVWHSGILRDKPEFAMAPHIDNSHVMIQIIVNLIKDCETATEFYKFDSSEPIYRAPVRCNHGVVFVNTPGALHSIKGITNTRYIWYAGVVI